MASRYGDSATPCPPVRRGGTESITSDEYKESWTLGDDSAIYGDYDETAAIEFTTELRFPVLGGAKPRKGGKVQGFKIHEDAVENVAGGHHQGREAAYPAVTKRMRKGSTMLGQPAQRFQRPKLAATKPSPKAMSPEANSARSFIALPAGPQEPNGNTEKVTQLNRELSPKVDLYKRDKRRGTIYIPPDDTTVPTVFMGMFSPLKTQVDQKSNSPVDHGLDSLDSRIMKKRQAKQSSLTAPRRAPLQQAKMPSQESTLKRDVAGQNTGKENVPPGQSIAIHDKKPEETDLDSPLFDLADIKKPNDLSPPEEVRLKPTQTKQRLELEPRKQQPSRARSTRKSPGRRPFENKPNTGSVEKPHIEKKIKAGPRPTTKASQGQRLDGRQLSSTSRPKQRTAKPAPSKLSVPNISPPNIDHRYPVLTEDLPNPAMYEENWLAHQEIAITQLINNLFDNTQGAPEMHDPNLIRHDILDIYQTKPFALLYKRLHASLNYGALAISKDAAKQANRLTGDIGLKREFLDLLMNTYDLYALKAAAETVIGRRLPVPQKKSSSSGVLNAPHNHSKRFRRELETFLETFLLQNQDAEIGKPREASENPGSPAWCYRRAVLRTIMIVVLLDRARSNTGTAMPRCLFVPSSKYKSSIAILQAVGKLLLPSAGDITRPLAHMDCHVDYVQNPLQEYEYRICNLAVDLRDGILLTRLVELLLYPSASLLSPRLDDNSTTTVALPTGEMLPLDLGERDWPLSQHLKLPCVGRAPKVYNVQVALSALCNVRGMDVIVKDIRPEDLVDGYREKTIALLWGLVGKWGLSGLADWDDVRNEINRLRRKIEQEGTNTIDESDIEASGEENLEDGYERCSFLLKEWASCLARLKGLRLHNLTTSFADGQIFQSIVDEYEGYILPMGDYSNSESKSVGKASLDSRLRALGCSGQFASLVAPKPSPTAGSSRIFDQDFTLAALAFLCSRLLPASKRVRAAVTIQRAWRRTLLRRHVQRDPSAQKAVKEHSASDDVHGRLLRAQRVIATWWRNQKVKGELHTAGDGRNVLKKQASGPAMSSKNKVKNRTSRDEKRVAFKFDARRGGGQYTADIDESLDSDPWLNL